MIRVGLEAPEVERVARAGVARMIVSLGVRDTVPTSPRERWGAHIEGAGAELAFAKWRGVDWIDAVGAGEFRSLAGDVGTVQIRSTHYANGCLVLYERDPDDAPFVLVVGAIPAFSIVGWIYGRDGKRPEFWRAGAARAAWFVPQWALRPIKADTSS